MAEITITKDNFKSEVLSSDKAVLIDFWANWCGPCRMQLPILEEFAQKHPEIKVGKINVDQEAELANEFNVMSIPFLALFYKGTMIKSSLGLQSLESLEELATISE